MNKILLAIVTVCAVVGVATAQEPTAIISTDNVLQLQPTVQIDYANAPAEAGELVTGWLRVSNDGTRVVTVNRANDLLLWDTYTGDLLTRYAVPGADGGSANMMDIAWHDADTAIHSLHTDGGAYYVAAYAPAAEDLAIITAPTGEDTPVRVWAAEDDTTTWIEVTPADPAQTPYVLQLDLGTGAVVQRLESAPEAVRDAGVRIGRMPAPLAVTSTPEGEVTLWDMERGEPVEVVSVAGMPMFGHINGGSGRKLVWRDPSNADLHLLDFGSGQNQLVAPLDGAYYQALLLTPTADVILGVNVDLEPLVVAWDVETGERTALGEYRACGRTPDMVQISTDGTTLVIGCDTGLDIWRVVP